MANRVLQAWNAEAVATADVPVLPVDEFQQIVTDILTAGGRVSSYFGREDAGRTLVTAVLADDAQGRLAVLSTRVGASWTSLTPECPSLQAFEREIFEQFGVRPEGHPWLKPLRFEPPLVPGVDPWGRLAQPSTIPGNYPFFRVDGEEVHEVAVGPVHAGVIEPGHFRFQCHGEHVFTLEIVLGYQHRGVEPMLVGGPGPAHGRADRVARRRHRRRQRHRPRQRRRGPRRLPDPGAGVGAPRRGAGAGKAREPRRRPRHAGRRRGLPPHGVVLRGAARRLPELAGRDLRQPLRPRPGRPRWRALRPRPGRRRPARRQGPARPGSRWTGPPASSSNPRRCGTASTAPAW